MLDPTVDWFKIIMDLQRAEMPQTQIAIEINVCPKTIRNYQQGITEPTYSKGVALINLYRSVIGST